jgi:hypothetical protein
MSEIKTKLSRRNFLLAVGAGGAAGAAAMVANTVPQAQPDAVALDKRRTRGYQASAHVRNYYRTAKV